MCRFINLNVQIHKPEHPSAVLTFHDPENSVECAACAVPRAVGVLRRGPPSPSSTASAPTPSDNAAVPRAVPRVPLHAILGVRVMDGRGVFRFMNLHIQVYESAHSGM